MSFFTCFWLLPQNEHLSRSPPSPMRATRSFPFAWDPSAGRTELRALRRYLAGPPEWAPLGPTRYRRAAPPPARGGTGLRSPSDCLQPASDSDRRLTSRHDLVDQ